MECREEKSISQSELARLLAVHHSIIGKYERDEVKPSIDLFKNIAAALDTTVGYLLGESKKQDELKDTAILKRLNDIASYPYEDKKHILYTLDALIKNIRLKAI